MTLNNSTVKVTIRPLKGLRRRIPGGGIFNSGTLTLGNSTVSKNQTGAGNQFSGRMTAAAAFSIRAQSISQTQSSPTTQWRQAVEAPTYSAHSTHRTIT